MNKSLLIACFVAFRLCALAADSLPQSIVGEWRNEREGFQTLSLYLFADGQGALFTATGATKATASYDIVVQLLRVVTDEGTFVFAHDDIANTLSSRGASYEKWPLKKQRAKIDQFIADHFTPEWSVTAKRLDVGRWIIYYRGELERVKRTDGSHDLRITGDVLTIDGRDRPYRGRV